MTFLVALSSPQVTKSHHDQAARNSVPSAERFRISSCGGIVYKVAEMSAVGIRSRIPGETFDKVSMRWSNGGNVTESGLSVTATIKFLETFIVSPARASIRTADTAGTSV